MIRKYNQLILDRGLNLNLDQDAIIRDNQKFLTELSSSSKNTKGKIISHLPNNPPFEIHPYKNLITLNTFDKYIIGTFPPISYVYDQLLNIDQVKQPISGGGRSLSKPGFPFFHGNRQLMWDYLLTSSEIRKIPANRDEVPKYLINFLNSVEINYSDIIDSAQRKLVDNTYKGNDLLLYNVHINNKLIRHILENPKAKYLLFNTASIYGTTGIENDNYGRVSLVKDAKAFDLFVRALQELGYNIQIRVNYGTNSNKQFGWTLISDLTLDQRKTKISFELKIINPTKNPSTFCKAFSPGEERELIIITPFSPAVAQRQNRLSGNPIVKYWLLSHSNQNTKSMLCEIYQDFRNGNCHKIFDLNK
ncbi:MAG: hypothetical protein M1292_03630 [Bacteroidetes bacterium]|nr:hypothetical protein [Bacteroidota bacterium]